MTVEQQVSAEHFFLRIHDERFHQAYFFQGNQNRLVAVNAFAWILDLAHRQDVRQRKSNFAQFEPNFGGAHAASLRLDESLSQRDFGIVGSDSARNRLRKFSSARSLLNAV